MLVVDGTVSVVAGTVVVVVSVVVVGCVGAGVVVVLGAVVVLGVVVVRVGNDAGASDLPSVAGSEASPIGWETSRLAR